MTNHVSEVGCKKSVAETDTDTDLETEAPSDCDAVFQSPTLQTAGTAVADDDDDDTPSTEDLVRHMEALNKANEQDVRSVSGSRRSGDSSSEAEASNNRPSPPVVDEEVDLWTLWGDLVKNWTVEAKRRPTYIRSQVRRGIPCHFRTIAWQCLAGTSDAAEQTHELYAACLSQQSVHEKKWKKSMIVEVIKRDIPRTYPEQEFFKDGGTGQQSLFNVMKAYSVHDPEVGYCQGSAFIVGQLLFQMPEEEAFGVFVKIMQDCGMRELYKPAMTELGLCMFQLECLVQEQMSDLYTHFNNMGFDTSMYASSWFLTLFTTQLPLDLANRIMDVFLSEGMEIVFRVSLAILQLSRFELLQLDMEGMLKHFQRELGQRFESDHELLMATAYRVSLDRKKMKRLEKDYMAKRSKEQEEAIELRRLRTENRLLRQRIDYLETESEALADRLIRGQVNLAQEAENSICISHELHKLRDINSDAHRKLEESYETIRELSNRQQHVQLDEVGVQVEDEGALAHIGQLQIELVSSRQELAKAESTVTVLKSRLSEAEKANKRLKETPPEGALAGLEEELIAIKMREAESALSLREMRHRLADFETQWTAYTVARQSQLQQEQSASVTGAGDANCQSAAASADIPTTTPPPPPPATTTTTTTSSGSARFSWLLPKGMPLISSTFSTLSSSQQQQHQQQQQQQEQQVSMDAATVAAFRDMEDRLMAVRIKELDTLAELKEMRQKVMEMETQNHVCTNQLKRQDEDVKKVKEENEELVNKVQAAESAHHEESLKLLESDAKLKEQSVMARLRENELLETISDLKKKCADIETTRAEKRVREELRSTSVDDEEDQLMAGSRLELMTRSQDAISLCSSEVEFNKTLADVTLKVPSNLSLDSLQRSRHLSASSGDATVVEN